jgi:hypothetical protein
MTGTTFILRWVELLQSTLYHCRSKIFPPFGLSQPWYPPAIVGPLRPFQSMVRVNPVMGDAAYNLRNLV